VRGAITAKRSFQILLVLVLAFLYGPLLHPILIALSENGRVGRGMTFTLERFSDMFAGSMVGPALWNTVVAAAFTGIITPAIALLGAFAVREFRYKRLIVMMMIVPLFIPSIAMGLASALFFKMLHIPSSLLTIILVHVIWALPFAFLIMLAVMAAFNTVYLEAAHMSGANRWRAFRDVELPFVWPGLSGAALFSAVISFNETIRTTLVQGGNNTIQTYIWSQFLQVGLSPQLFALMASLILLTIGLVMIMIILSLWQVPKP
jgi:ABC-type spermidine/putrescine transport system permease subunit II